MSQEWYVKYPDRVAGPLSATQLRTLAQMGRLQPDDEVSMDMEKWHKASRIKGLTFAKPQEDSTKKSGDSGATVVMRAEE